MTIKPKRITGRSQKSAASKEPPSYWSRAATDLDREDAAIEKAGTGAMEPGVRVNPVDKKPDPD